MKTCQTLHNGDSIPILGLGTYRMRTIEELRPVVVEAIKSGYRLIDVDSATVYRNEEALGKILKEVFADPSLGVERSDIFITSKLAPKDQGYDACYQAVLDSLRKFDLEYLDLYLIHWPGTSKKKLSDPINQENRAGSYKALEQLYREGKIKHIGVSNYTYNHLSHLLETCTIIPHVHQFELHPCLFQPEIFELCKKNNIQIQAYSSLGEGALINGQVKIDVLDDISRRINKSKALVLLRWAVQHDWIIIPKSKTVDRIQENAKVLTFEISDDDMSLLDNVHAYETRRFCWDPTEIV